MTSFNDGIEAAREKLHHRLADIGGCLDGNCMVVRPNGVHTNGGCQCLKNWTKAQQVVNAYKAFEAEVSTLKRPEPSEAEKVERVARALCEADGEDPDHEVRGGQSQDFENYGPRWKADVLGLTNYEKMARAALAAMGRV